VICWTIWPITSITPISTVKNVFVCLLLFSFPLIIDGGTHYCSVIMQVVIWLLLFGLKEKSGSRSVPLKIGAPIQRVRGSLSLYIGDI
jgi:hypothetical protein